MKTFGKIIIFSILIFNVLAGTAIDKVFAKSKDFEIDKNYELYYYNGNDKIVKIPANVKKIGAYVFEDNNKIEKVILPEGLTVIDTFAFSGCGKLKEVVLPSTLKTIESFAFNDCTGLSNIQFPEGLTKIEEYAFCGCSNIKEITLPSTLKTIEDASFMDCFDLKKITLKKGIEEIKDCAFSHCKINELILPSTLKYFNGYSINGCENLKEINIPRECRVYDWKDINEFNGLERIDVDSGNKYYMSIDGVVFSKDGKTIICYPSNRREESYKIPDSVFYINKARFFDAIYLKHLAFGKHVTWKKTTDLDGTSFMNGVLADITVPIENKTFCDVDGVLFTKDKKTLIAYPDWKTSEIYIIPFGTENLSEFAFSANSNCYDNFKLKYLFVPPSVKKFIDICCVGDSEFLSDNQDIIIFGQKGSAAEKFADGGNTDKFQFKFRAYDMNEKIMLTETQVELYAGETINLFAISLSSYSMIPVSWKSSNESVISVADNGVVDANESGTAFITVTSEKGDSASCDFNIKLKKPDD